MKPKRSPRSKPSATELTVKQKVRQEGIKLFYDIAKHLTTLNAGAVVIIASLYDKIPVNERLGGNVKISLVLFVISVIFCAFSMVYLGMAINVNTNENEWNQKIDLKILLNPPAYVGGVMCLFIAFLLFIAGLGNLVDELMPPSLLQQLYPQLYR